MLLRLFWSFFKIGAFTFGSGYAMIPMIVKEVVDKRKWFDRDDFFNQFTIAQSMPGPFALNTAVFVGYRMKGFPGALVSVLGSVIPSFTIILLIAVYLTDFKDNPYVAAAFMGIRPAVVALIAVPFVKMLFKLKKWYKWAVAFAAALSIWLFGISPVWFLLAGALTGVILTWIPTRRGGKGQ